MWSRHFLFRNAAIQSSIQNELSQFSRQSGQQSSWRQARLKAMAAASVTDRSPTLRNSSSSNDSSASKRDKQSELVHPLFTKERQKEKAAGEAKASKPSSSSLTAKRSPKPVPKSEQKPLKASQTSATGSTLTELESQQRSRSPSRKPAKSDTAGPVATKAQQAVSSQGVKGAREKGPKNQVAFAPQPTKLRMAPTSPDAIADPYQ